MLTPNQIAEGLRLLDDVVDKAFAYGQSDADGIDERELDVDAAAAGRAKRKLANFIKGCTRSDTVTIDILQATPLVRQRTRPGKSMAAEPRP